jgi:glycosyltransferase involved in cell wall biosynthesis
MTPRRIAIVASEILGVPGTGGPGTADSLLAVALGRRGHDVELLVAPGRDVSRVTTAWHERNAAANVRIRPLEDDGSLRPSFLAPAAGVYEALRRDPPEVVVADDWRALPYASLRTRQLGLGFPDTAFVLYCHGPARVFAAAARKVPDTVERFGEEIAQRASFELADAVVSPSAWLVEWLRAHRWPLRDSVHVIQNLWQSVALGEPVQPAGSGARIRRLAFFGQVREGKGIRVFLDSVRKLGPQSLDGIELLFLGHSRQWREEDLRRELAGLSASVRLETQLDRTSALEELRQPGTLAVMPSLLENSPYAVAECIEHGVPFLAADVGGTPELVASKDRARVLHRPTSDAFAAALRLALEDGVETARPARPPKESLAAWLEVVENVTPPARPTAPEAADLVLWHEPDVTLDEGAVEALRRAQAASAADVVTCAVRTPDGGRRLFLGDPGPLGLIENQYGVVGLVPRASVTEDDPELSAWIFFARLALAGARIVSVPDVLGGQPTRPPSGAERLAVLEAFEQAGPEALSELPQLTATLAAASARARSDGTSPSRRGRLWRLLRLGSS